MIAKNVDILAVSETKLDESFPTSQFQIRKRKIMKLAISWISMD